MGRLFATPTFVQTSLHWSYTRLYATVAKTLWQRVLTVQKNRLVIQNVPHCILVPPHEPLRSPLDEHIVLYKGPAKSVNGHRARTGNDVLGWYPA